MTRLDHMQPDVSVIGIDIGGTNLRFALVRGADGIVARHRAPTRIEEGWAALQDSLHDGIARLMREGRTRGTTPRAIGVGVPGLIGADGHVHSSVNLPPLEGNNIRECLERLTGIPVIAANDANAIAFGERAFGAGRPFDSFIMLTLGTGVGSGLVLGGRLWTGSRGFAAEFGHATVEPDGRRCGCGNRGCLEQYASASAIVRTAIAGAASSGSSLATLAPGEITARAVAEAAAAGDRFAVGVFAGAGRALGIATATLVNLLDLDAVVLGGGVADSFPLLAGPLREEIATRAFPQMAAGLSIVKGELGDDAGLLGSAVLAAEAVSSGGLR
jgi:glucokinase